MDRHWNPSLSCLDAIPAPGAGSRHSAKMTRIGSAKRAVASSSRPGRRTGKSRTCFDQCKALTAYRRELPEMADCAVGIQRETLKRLDESFKGFFNRLKKGAKAGFPRFRERPLSRSHCKGPARRLQGRQSRPLPCLTPSCVRRCFRSRTNARRRPPSSSIDRANIRKSYDAVIPCLTNPAPSC